ncbi:MAG: cold shock protein [Bacteroidetes bacterium]|jgi:cold shock CspA family protein|nr:cold shock protein [Bacteroidota bacterium]
MARSKQTSQKSEKEKTKKRKQKEKEEKKAERKKNSNKGKGFDSMIAYVDHNGQLSDTPPDPRLKVEIKVEDILLGPRTFEREEKSAHRSGRVAIYNTEKNYGFIKDSITQEKTFFHRSNIIGTVSEGDLVSYELEQGLKGINAVKVTKIN